jgi:hypothetical protein
LATPQLADGVVPADDPIPHGQLAVLDLQPLPSEATPGGQQLLAGGVEPIDLGPPGGQHDDLLRRVLVGLRRVLVGLLEGGPPVLEQGQGGGRLGLRRDDPVMGPVGGHGLLDQPRPDQLEGLAFPSLLLPSILDQLGRAKS